MTVISKIDYPKTRSVQLLLSFPLWVYATLYGLSLIIPKSSRPYDCSDIALSAVVVMEIVVAILLSAWRNKDISDWLDTYTPLQRPRRRSVAFLSVMILFALVAIFIAQIVLQNLRSSIESDKVKGVVEDFLILDVLNFAILSWTILLAYKMKLFWDHLVKVMGAK